MNIDKDLVAASATPLVLAILGEGESYGYAIVKRVVALSGGELQWTDGMLYPLLHRLERWQTSYMPAFAAWAGIVTVLFPVVFNYR